jgi:ketosteroid isomerase-like protein
MEHPDNTPELSGGDLAARIEHDTQLVAQAYEAVHLQRDDLIERFFAPDFVLVQSPAHPDPGEHEGLAAAGASLARTFRAVGAVRSEVRQIAADGHGTAFVVFRMIWPYSWSMDLIELVTIRDGLIAEIRPFSWDPRRLRQLAAGADGSPASSGVIES